MREKQRLADRARRELPRQHRVSLIEETSVSTALFDSALADARGTRATRIIDDKLGRRRDATARLSVLGLFVAMSLHGRERHHRMHAVEWVRKLNSLNNHQLRQLGMPQWKRDSGGYDRVWRLHDRICKLLATGWDHVDAGTGEILEINSDWFMSETILSSVPLDLIQGAAIAIDGTDLPTHAVVAFDVKDEHVDRGGTPGESNGKSIESGAKAKVYGVGPDGRPIFTKDFDARAGHRSAVNSRRAGPYIGRELHIGATVPALTSTDGVTYANFGPAVPSFVVVARATPAGTHRGNAVTDLLLGASEAGYCAEVLADGGYTLMRAETFHFPLQAAGVGLTMRPASHQVGEKAGLGRAIVVDGQIFSDLLPQELRDLRLPDRSSTQLQIAEVTAKYNRRAAFRYGHHQTSVETGVTRWMCPVHRGTVRCRANARSMRNSKSAPLVALAEGVSTCCDGVVSVGADQLPLRQRTIVGTTAWHAAFARRNLIETVNSELKDTFVRLDAGFVRTFNSTKISMALAFTLAGYNHRALSRWNKDQELRALDVGQPKKRKPRTGRLARWEDIGQPGTSRRRTG